MDTSIVENDKNNQEPYLDYSGTPEAKFSIPAKFVSNPFPAINYKTGEPIVSASGNKLYKAFVTLPKDIKVNNLDISNRQVVVDYAWGEQALESRNDQKSNNKILWFTAPVDKDGKVYLHPVKDADGETIKEAIKIEKIEFVKAILENRTEYIINNMEKSMESIDDKEVQQPLHEQGQAAVKASDALFQGDDDSKESLKMPVP